MIKATDSENISVDDRIDSLLRFGEKIKESITSFKAGKNSELNDILIKAKIENPWFTESNVIFALDNWSSALNKNDVLKWVNKYAPLIKNSVTAKVVGVVNAGNIPFVGLHDMLSVLLCGHLYKAKNATSDTILLPYLASLLISINHAFKNRIQFVDRLEKIDAVIATGNNNSARYFEYYFGKYPHIIRQNRNGIAILDGKETKEQLGELGKDIFTFFGLGCRNVSKIFVPRKYDFRELFESMFQFNEIMSHSKYMNNFDYNNSVYLLKRIKFLQNGFLIITEEERISSPVSVLFYQEYDDINILTKNLAEKSEQIQCIASAKSRFEKESNLNNISVEFGKTQTPSLWDYADGVNTLDFLCSL